MKKTISALITLVLAFTLLAMPASAYNDRIADVCNKNTGRLIIGDSRCYQLYKQDSKGASFTAVWGGHYGDGCGEDHTINSAARRKHMKKYVRASIKAKGKCNVFIFATINDYDRGQDYNFRMNKLIQQAREIRDLEYSCKGEMIKPKVYIVKLIGFEPEEEEYNANIGKYNKRLSRLAKKNGMSVIDLSGCLKGKYGGYKAPYNLHYSKATLRRMWKRIKAY